MNDEAREQQLAVIIDEMVSRAARGEPVDVEAVCRQHPELQTELRELWATAVVAEDFASAEGDNNFGRVAGVERSEPPAVRDVPAPSGRPHPPTDATTPPTDVADYDILEEIGRGGMGVVYRARQKSLDRIVALKMILQADFASEADLQRFRREAEAAARLDHPHIVPVYQVGATAGRPFFSMRYVEGTTLARRIAEGPLPPRDAAALLIPVCRAVAEAHRRGVLHRDLKPSNILLDADGRPYVSDFGLAKRFAAVSAEPASATQETDVLPAASGSMTHSGAIVGTPGYMAPEQAAGRGNELSVATDVYSLGALLYAMLTGRAPFQAASPVDTVLMVLEQEPLPPRLLNRNTDPELEMIVLKCLQKPADLRYPFADALADDLQAYLDGEPVSARSSRLSQVLSRAFRETHHAPVLENWGLLWMWHSLVLVVLCAVTNWFQWNGVTSRLPYVGLWSVGLGLWAGIFWHLRRRSGPTTFVERQIAHVWAGSVIASTLLFGVEALLDLPVLELSPVLGVISGMVFLAKAGILTGRFYVQAAGGFATGMLMAYLQSFEGPDVGILLFGVVAAASFFFPGLKYYRQRSTG